MTKERTPETKFSNRPATKKTVETELKKAIKSLFKALRIHCEHNLAGIGTTRGRPDLEAVYKGITYYIETKHYKTGIMSDFQQRYRKKLEDAGAPYIHATSVEDVIRGMDLPVLFK